MQNLAGKRALITGAGHGLGRELARTFARAGAEVVVTDLDPDRVANTVRQIIEDGGRAVGYTMDVTDAECVKDVRERLHKEHGPINVLVNNAGMVYGGDFLGVPLSKHLLTYQINAVGLITVTHTFLRDLIGSGEANVVNVASASGLIPLPFAATYCSTKWAVIGFSESLGEELRLQGNGHVCVTTICPSYIGTGMFTGVTLPRF